MNWSRPSAASFEWPLGAMFPVRTDWWIELSARTAVRASRAPAGPSHAAAVVVLLLHRRHQRFGDRRSGEAFGILAVRAQQIADDLEVGPSIGLDRGRGRAAGQVLERSRVDLFY